MKAMCFECRITEVGNKICKVERVIKTLSPTNWEIYQPVVTPLSEGMVLVTIYYDWGYGFSVPQNFEDYVTEEIKERCYDFCNNLDKISEVLDMDLYFDSIIAQYVDKKSRKSYPLWKLMRELDKLPDEKVQDILISRV